MSKIIINTLLKKYFLFGKFRNKFRRIFAADDYQKYVISLKNDKDVDKL